MHHSVGEQVKRDMELAFDHGPNGASQGGEIRNRIARFILNVGNSDLRQRKTKVKKLKNKGYTQCRKDRSDVYGG